MVKKLLFGFSTLALLVASAANNYKFTLYGPTLIGSTELKAGEYKIEVNDNKAVVKHGGTVAEANVKVETADQKYDQTAIRCVDKDGKNHLQEIHVGGTRTKLVFSD